MFARNCFASRLTRATLLSAVFISVVAPPFTSQAVGAVPADSACKNTDTGIVLSPGFCATVFADAIGHARHLVVSPQGVVYVNTWSGRYYEDETSPQGEFVVALKDTTGKGTADVIKRFGGDVAHGSAGGTGIGFYHDALFVEMNDKILRFELGAGEIVPTHPAETIVSGLPLTGDHPMHPFLIDPKGSLFVDLGSATNACEEQNRMPGSHGKSPCVEKQTRGGTWLFDANKRDQVFSASQRYATGIRNGEGMALDSAGRLFVTQHGRDQLGQNWQAIYKPEQGTELPAEELVRLGEGKDYGWPECYYDGFQKKLILGPEYGGDGKKQGVCATRSLPVAIFPAHWAPNALLIDLNPKFPAVYRDGAFIAFHGSWNRAPAAQAGYNVVFQPLKEGKANGKFIVFADGFAGAVKEPGRAAFRPSGLAAGPDGALYISDDAHGRIWRVTYQGNTPARLASAPALPSPLKSSGNAVPPEGTHSDAGRAVPTLAIPPGGSAEQVQLGNSIFHGEVSSGTCAGCHGSDGKGSPVGPNLTTGKWLWGDGSPSAIAKTIAEGVATPKKTPGAMPPKGGAPLSDSDVKAVAAYVWAISQSP